MAGAGDQPDGQDEKETAEDGGGGLRGSSSTPACFQSAVTELRPAAAVTVHGTKRIACM